MIHTDMKTFGHLIVVNSDIYNIRRHGKNRLLLDLGGVDLPLPIFQKLLVADSALPMLKVVRHKEKNIEIGSVRERRL